MAYGRKNGRPLVFTEKYERSVIVFIRKNLGLQKSKSKTQNMVYG